MLIWTGQRKWPTTSLQIPLKLQKFFQNFEQRSLLKYNALSYIPFKQLQLIMSHEILTLKTWKS